MAARITNVRYIRNACITNPSYPAALVNGANVYDERIMSMPTMMSSQDNFATAATTYSGPPTKLGSYFFFIFNFENYYHFLYDTLPYLIVYLRLRDVEPDCKLLLPKNCKLLQFHHEIFELLGINTCSIAFPYDDEQAEEGAVYENLYVPGSFTHGRTASGESASNLPPSPEAREIWNRLKEAAMALNTNAIYAKKIYVSRRTWINKDLDNIGTNYTTRRKCENENEVVKTLKQHGFAEVFCESLSMVEKIKLFAGAKVVAGFIGGGMANCLFSDPDCRVVCLETPEFLTINSRFVHSMGHCCTDYLKCCELAAHEGPFPLYVRAKTPDGVGEIDSFNPVTRKYTVKLAGGNVAGFTLGSEYKMREYAADLLEPLDHGLNSPFICDLEKLQDGFNRCCK